MNGNNSYKYSLLYIFILLSYALVGTLILYCCKSFVL